jgi:DNA topoisomerase-6 subunit B
MAAARKTRETAESMGRRQRDISVSEFFLKNRHLLGFDNPRKALLTAVKEAVDNAMDACEEAGIVPELSVEIVQTDENRFRMTVTDNGPGIVKAQLPRIFAKLLYGSKFHRLRMSRGQQGIGISAAGMYGQLTTGTATSVLSRTRRADYANSVEVQVDARRNKPNVLRSGQVDWHPEFPGEDEPVVSTHGTSVSIEMEASYARGKLSVDEYLQQCAVVNPHLTLHYRVVLKKKDRSTGEWVCVSAEGKSLGDVADARWVTYARGNRELPPEHAEIKPHPHGVELGLLMQMLKDTKARTLRSALNQDFSRVSSATALRICEEAGLDPKARPSRIAQREAETLFKAITQTKLMRPPTDCLAPIGEDQILAGLRKEVDAEFYTAVTRVPAVYRGNPFQIEAAVAYVKRGEKGGAADSPARVMRFANRVPLLYMGGGCAVTKAVQGVNWKAYGLSQPRGSLPVGPLVVMVHIASVWVPFTSESKEAIAHYPEIIKEMTFALQECGRRLSGHLNKRKRQAEVERKRNYMTLYVPHLAAGLKGVLDLGDKKESEVVEKLNAMLERTRLDV